ncbi:NAD(P)-binding domain-containing protein [Cellulomonas sp. Marseille-Q8402]
MTGNESRVRGVGRGVPDLTPTDFADVVVVGAGQAGLAVAAHLARSGFRPADRTAPGPGPTYVVLDASAGPGGAWRERWPGLTMRTVNGVYELPGRPLPRFDADEPASSALTRYFGEYEHDLGLPVRRAVQVRAVRDAGGPERLLAVETVERPVADPDVADPSAAARAREAATSAATRPGPDDGLGGGAGPWRPVPAPVEPQDLRPSAAGRPARRRAVRTWHARAVVNATGTWTRPFWPTYPGAVAFAGTQLHTHDYRAAEDFAGRRVLVVGGGISAVQHLLAIHPVAAATTWVTRRPPDWRDDEFSPELGRDAVARVDARTRAGLPPQSIVAATGLPLTDEYRAGIADGVLVARPVFARLVPDGARWDPAVAQHPPADGWVAGPEHVAADVVLWATGFRAALDHLRPLGLRDAGGGIVMDGTRVVADPRVQLVGYGPSASTVGANRAGRAAVRQVRRLLGV